MVERNERTKPLSDILKIRNINIQNLSVLKEVDNGEVNSENSHENTQKTNWSVTAMKESIEVMLNENEIDEEVIDDEGD